MGSIQDRIPSTAAASAVRPSHERSRAGQAAPVPSRANANSMADETTPLIRNCWYVAALSADLAPGKLFARRLLDVNVVLYRTENGIAALHDRCAHRSMPLSDGYIQDDKVVCGYHGFRYGTEGICDHVPSQPERCPGGISVRSFPVVEHSPHVWIWMGDPGLADPAQIPGAAWMRDSDEWTGSHGYMHVKSNYVFLHENLLDLSHLSYLHAKTFGTPDYASAPFDIQTGDGEFIVQRTVAPTRLPPVYAEPTGMTGVDAARIVTSTYVSPALSYTELLLRNLELPQEQRRDFHLKTAQIITPESDGTLHYHFTVVRDFALHDQAMSEFILKSIKAAFHEDVYALERITQVRLGEPVFHERSVAADRAGVAMRKHLKKLADHENPPTQPV
ncbi:vanillate O-demethylase monooxygenase subunit [Pusillimonas noertemannii]|uniref:Vanillate O-demethylase monooxygenase subunit n=2 Tax=Pusillimonas noertemannii TaxID=305977 RepID=A0A2U1CNF9_9BURK|nr:vanillate O-demethylase monooxygenase subunit [Pusillimonas noertemannii]TFL10499.1 aromatic ring-hydroxylating dioxygenase subunit alpha [Pusillimonas noertemannii]